MKYGYECTVLTTFNYIRWKRSKVTRSGKITTDTIGPISFIDDMAIDYLIFFFFNVNYV